MKNNNTHDANAFMTLAKRDLNNAKRFIDILKIEADEGLVSALCFYLSQSTEKVIKALLLSLNPTKISYSHNITKLILAFEDLGYKVPTLIDENCSILEDWAISSRYNINFKCDLDLAIKIEEVLSDWINNIESLDC